MESIPVNFLEIANKAGNKHDMYKVLTIEGVMYFPPELQTNMDFISDMWFKKKKVIP